MTAVTDALEAGTTGRTGGTGPPARFTIELRAEPQSALERGVLVVELPDRTFDDVTPAAAFATAYDLADAFDAVTGEPELPTVFFPEVDPPDPGEPVQESIGAVSGCTVDKEPALAPDWAGRHPRAGRPRRTLGESAVVVRGGIPRTSAVLRRLRRGSQLGLGEPDVAGTSLKTNDAHAIARGADQLTELGVPVVAPTL
jgi:hypothetical protein